MLKIDFLGYPLAENPFPVTIDKSTRIIINTINQYSYCIAERDSTYKKAIQTSDILLPDGMAIVKACKFITGKLVKKIAGADMHDHLLETLNQQQGKCFYLGSSEETLNKIKVRVEQEYPALCVASHSPPFKPFFNEDDISEMVDVINRFQPDVVFIGLTAPKQEKLSCIFKERLHTSVICSIGAVFDFYAGTINRPSQFWINSNLEWFIRLVREPKRMWKRYIYYGFIFIYDIARAKAVHSGSLS